MKRIKKIETSFQYIFDGAFPPPFSTPTVTYETSDGWVFDSFDNAERHETFVELNDKYNTLFEHFSIETGRGSCIFYVKSKEEYHVILDYWMHESYAYNGSRERKEFFYPTHLELEVSHVDKTFQLYQAESIDEAFDIVNWVLSHSHVQI